MSNKDRPGKTISFYADHQTLDKLNEMAKQENRSISNMLRLIIIRAWEMRFPPQYEMTDHTIPIEK